MAGSKEGQDRWVLSVLQGKRNGYFVDIGAHDGKDDSNTYQLEKEYGWTGICVEPCTAGFKALKKNRKCILDHTVIYSTSGSVPFINREAHKQLSGIPTEDCCSYYTEQAKATGHPVETRQAITIGTLLSKYNAPTCIDYLSLDTEGAEYEILRVLDFNKYIFRTITVEHNYTKKCDYRKQDRDRREAIRRLLTGNGYTYVTPEDCQSADDYYVHKGTL
jgi:FkbM family methyltransferase